MGSENTYWKWLRGGLKSIRDLDIQRIESKIGSGVPDVEGCWAGKCFWVELKACDRPKRPTSKLDFRISQQQIVWLHRRWRIGGNAFVLLRVGHGRDARDYLVKGEHAHLLHSCTEKTVERFSIIKRVLTQIDILHTLTNGRGFIIRGAQLSDPIVR